MTKFLILFAIVAFASVNAQFHRNNNGFPGAGFLPGFPGFPGFAGFPGFPLPLPQVPTRFPSLTPEGAANLEPIPGGKVSSSSSSFVASNLNGKTEMIVGTNTDGKEKIYHFSS